MLIRDMENISENIKERYEEGKHNFNYMNLFFEMSDKIIEIFIEKEDFTEILNYDLKIIDFMIDGEVLNIAKLKLDFYFEDDESYKEEYIAYLILNDSKTFEVFSNFIKEGKLNIYRYKEDYYILQEFNLLFEDTFLEETYVILEKLKDDLKNIEDEEYSFIIEEFEIEDNIESLKRIEESLNEYEEETEKSIEHEDLKKLL